MKKQYTIPFMFVSVALWVAYDIYIYFAVGNAATESASVWRNAYLSPGLPAIVGTLMGHLFGQLRAPSIGSVAAPSWYPIGQAVSFFCLVGWLGWDGWVYWKTQAPSVIDQWVWTITFHQVWLVFLLGFGNGMLFFQMHEPTILPTDSEPESKFPKAA